ncbi:hypothetical protein A2841_02385 [Candidatus Kaiserbacteria bacterium RIFCSPHIGHO2_01_FULL_48_10]|uniref:Cell division protein FtsX n=1 Tax=Candidatus Kaiserbacteria bacterium RIFCSPHIGHO2_01_FULL_48_10 TaxID=1798476 RepID=A0A1F6C2P4_9BACT|nr:MAG: hypothetical protein A2841_02385 [Candidatus Kaiserbacteria bacterium RIFCSPHIGHO2_01_FULL_48_10]
MFWENIRRIVRTGVTNFLRSGFISLTAILMIMVPLFILSSLLFTNFLLEEEIRSLQDRVDINVYFVTTTTEEKILALKQQLEKLPEIASAEYLSAEDVLQRFRTRHENDQLTLQALDELGENPFGATLSIKAKEVSQYSGIADFLSDRMTDETGQAFIDDINYYRNKVTIGQLGDMVDRTQREKIIQTLFLAVIALFVIFNTIRLTIYHSREEIGVMRLVGASNAYIEGPFIVEGLLYGSVGAIIILILLFPVTYWFGSYFSVFPSITGSVSDIRVFEYYVSHFLYVSFVILGTSLLLSGASSFVAVRKYLSV